MPSVSMFYGIVIYFYSKEHNPPHFHAIYQGKRASFDLQGNLIKGKLPLKQQKLITAWSILHEEELKANWDLVVSGEVPYKIEPLR